MASTEELPPPFVRIPGLPNMRDLGGLPADATKTKVIRPGVIFRSSEPSKVTDEGVSILTNELGITHVFDLRSKVEIDRAQGHGASTGWEPREWPGAQRVFVPVFLDEDYSPEALAARIAHYAHQDPEQGFVKAYDSILTSAADPDHPYAPFSTILNHIAGPEPSPMLIHCTAGKDRTGVICALVLSLCGVDDETIAEEYALTQIGLQPRRKELVEHLLRVAETMNIESIRGNPEAAERMVGARKESMLGTLALIRRKYGSIEGYVVEQCRVTPTAIDQIRQNLVVDAEQQDAGRPDL